MLEQMREGSKNGLTMVIFVIIGVVFAISFGAPMDGCQQQSQGPKYLASANGTDVTTKDVQIILNKYQTRNMSDDELTMERSKALKAAILIHLLADEARNLGLRVSEEEFKAYMVDALQNADFRQVYSTDNGKLNGGMYRNYIENQLRVTMMDYEAF